MKQGEIWLIDLEPTVGAEMKKICPAVIINDNALGILPLKIIVPITDWKERYNSVPWMIPISPFSYGKSQIDNVVKYIKNQEKHHKKRDFAHEYMEFLRLFGVEFDERYVLKNPE